MIVRSEHMYEYKAKCIERILETYLQYKAGKYSHKTSMFEYKASIYSYRTSMYEYEANMQS